MTSTHLISRNLTSMCRAWPVAIFGLAIGTVAWALAQETPPEAHQPMTKRERVKQLGPDAYTLTAPVDAEAVMATEFRHRLSRQRILGTFLPPLQPSPCLPKEETPPEELTHLFRWAKVLFEPDHLPDDLSQIEWCATKSSPKSLEINHAKGEWAEDGVPFAIKGATRLTSVRVRLTLSGDHRIPFREYSREALEKVGVSGHVIHLDEDKLLAVLTTFFQCPFASTDEFDVSAGSLVYEGVRFYPGRIRSRVHLNTDDPNVQPYDSPSPWAEVILFVTDTQPQYLCLTFDTKHIDALEKDESR